jgi:outer membrane immunogenic protein
MKKLWLTAGGIAVFVAASSPAFAADMSVKAPPPQAYNYNWTGLYIGGNLGGAWSHSTLTDDLTGVSIDGDNHSGFIGGGQIGYNWQVWPQFVLGVEWMFDGTDISHTGSGVTIGNTLLQGTERTDWVSTLTARFGYAVNNWLFYGKVGGGWVQNSATVTATFADGTVGSVSGSNTNSGWTAGLGIEYGFAQNWSFKVEWDYLGLNSWDTGSGTLANIDPRVTTFVGDRFDLHRDINMLTVGVNYKFLWY